MKAKYVGIALMPLVIYATVVAFTWALTNFMKLLETGVDWLLTTGIPGPIIFAGFLLLVGCILAGVSWLNERGV